MVRVDLVDTTLPDAYAHWPEQMTWAVTPLVILSNQTANIYLDSVPAGS